MAAKKSAAKKKSGARRPAARRGRPAKKPAAKRPAAKRPAAKKPAAKRAAAPAKAGRPRSELRDTTLGTLTWNADLAWYEGRPKVGRRDVGLHVAPPPNSGPASLLARARRVVSDLDGYERKAKAVAARELLALKNEVWRDPDEPLATAADFRRRMKLEGVKVSGAGDVTFFFRDGGLFFGHAVVVELDPSDAPFGAEIAG